MPAAAPETPIYAPQTGLRYLFIDFNAYFAAVEQHDDPALVGRPVIVAPLESENTGAIAVSYEARAFGIRRGTTIREARVLCPGVCVRSARHDRYVQVHKLLITEITRVLPLEKIYSIDEAAFRLNRSEASPEAALPVALAVRRALAENVGPCLRASIGLAPTRLLAKLAAELKKPDGLTCLSMAELPGRLADIPITDIPGVGPNMALRLERAGVRDFLSLWALQPKQARAIWRGVTGERFWYALHGYEVEEPATKKSMIGHSRVLGREYEPPDRARIVGRALLLKAASRLRHYGMHASTLSASVRLRPQGGWEGARRFAYSQNTYLFLKTFDDLWDTFLAARRMPGERGALRCGGVTIYLHGLVPEGDPKLAQGDLFTQARPEDIRQARLWSAIDAINADEKKKFRRLGRVPDDAPARRYVTLARQHGLALNYLGAKIAFSRVPEEAEFLY